MLQLFQFKKGEVVSRTEILDKIWGKDQFPTTRTIDNFILNFRKYFARPPPFRPLPTRIPRKPYYESPYYTHTTPGSTYQESSPTVLDPVDLEPTEPYKPPTPRSDFRGDSNESFTDANKWPRATAAFESFNRAQSANRANTQQDDLTDSDEELTSEEQETVNQAVQDAMDYLNPPDEDDYEIDNVPRRSASRSLRSMQQSVRSWRSANHERTRGKYKVRSMITSDKIQWNGRRSSFPEFQTDLEGTMMKLGLGYMLDKEVQAAYRAQGKSLGKEEWFYEDYGINFNQLKHDVQYLYGVLLSSTKSRRLAVVWRYYDSKDGLSGLMDTVREYGHGGSLQNKADELEDHLLSTFDPDMIRDLPTYLENYQGWAEELTALQGDTYDDAWYKRTLLRNLKALPESQAHWVTKCEDEVEMGFNATIEHLRKKALQHKRYKDKVRPKQTARLHKATRDKEEEPQEETTVEKVAQTIQSIMNESDAPIAVFYAMQKSQTMRESLMIPQSI